MIFETLRALLGPEIHTNERAALRPGKVVVQGVVKGVEAPLRSPIRQVPCVAYFYVATYSAPSRGRAVTRPIREAVVYAPEFTLELEGGPVRVRPSKSDEFDGGSHQGLLQAGLVGFHAEEQLIRVGDRIEIRGKAQGEGEEWVLIPKEILLSQAPSTESTPSASRKKRRKE